MLSITKAKLKKAIADKKLISPYFIISVYGDLKEGQHCMYSI
jgi:hypothetical protein